MTATLKGSLRTFEHRYEVAQPQYPEVLVRARQLAKHAPELGNWAVSGNCMSIDPVNFTAETPEAEAAAKAICHGCTAEASPACLDFALALKGNLRGLIVAGMTEAERRLLARTQTITPGPIFDEFAAQVTFIGDEQSVRQLVEV
jgi:hypothetical protein